jgi:hypothetical protein
MYDAKKAKVDETAVRFNRLLAAEDPGAGEAGTEYLTALTDLIQSFNSGPAADPRIMGMDTTGELTRTDDHVAWAEQERHRVRKELRELR